MDLANHVDAYFAAIGRRDIQEAVTHFTEDAILRSPVFTEPFVGREAIATVLTKLLETIDGHETKLLVRQDQELFVVFQLQSGGAVVDGFDHFHVNEEGMIENLLVAWRPLPEAAKIQQRLAPKLGFEALQLVPLEA
jgi:ketosteroid isomerase-like protein